MLLYCLCVGFLLFVMPGDVEFCCDFRCICLGGRKRALSRHVSDMFWCLLLTMNFINNSLKLMKRLLVSVILKAVSVKGYFSYLLGLRIREQFLHSKNDQVFFLHCNRY